MHKKRFHFSILIFLFSALLSLSAQNEVRLPPRKPLNRPGDMMNLNGRQMQRRSGIFAVIGVKVEEFGDELAVSVYFSDALDTNSVNAKKILVNGANLPQDSEFLFNKNRRMLRLQIEKSLAGEKPFSLTISSLKSFDGRKLITFEEDNLEAGAFPKYPIKAGDGRKEQKCQESSL